MVEFPELVAAGAAAAFMTDRSDGDCGWPESSSEGTIRVPANAPVPGDRLVALRQCHGETILLATSRDAGRGATLRDDALGEADGLVTEARGLPLGITVADCVPVFLVSPHGIGLLHAGRTGTAQGIASLGVRALADRLEITPSSIFALIGPSAGPCCYQVSSDICTAWARIGLTATGDHLDLWESNRQQLRHVGVPDSQILVDGRCTICQPGFYSYRGQRTTARNLAVLML